MKYAALNIAGNEHIYDAINVFEPADLVHDFYLSRKYEKGLSNRYLRYAFDDFISEQIRNGKTRRKIAPSLVNSQNKVLGDFTGNYKDSDLIDGYIYRNTRNKGEMRSL